MLATIATIEELAANAVLPLIAQDVDGWRFRYGSGITRRANSVLALHHYGTLPFETKLALAEAFYAKYQLICRFQLCPASQPVELDQQLEAYGYIRSAPTDIKTAPLAPIAAQATRQTTIADRFDSEWLAAYAEGEGGVSDAGVAAKSAMLSRIAPTIGFARFQDGAELAAVALGVVERGYLGIFSVSTRPAYRRRGIARLVLADLAAWAIAQGATQAYLQVMSSNTPAQHLYTQLGFSNCYQYWYRERHKSV